MVSGALPLRGDTAAGEESDSPVTRIRSGLMAEAARLRGLELLRLLDFRLCFLLLSSSFSGAGGAGCSGGGVSIAPGGRDIGRAL
jgi:hypothetical protein